VSGEARAGDVTPSLVARLRAGDDDAGAVLVASYGEPLRRFAARYVGDADARDVVQEVFCEVLASKTVPDDFRAWVYRAVRNRALNLLRGRRRNGAERLDTGAPLAADATGIPTALARGEQGARAAAAVRTLSPRQQEVLHLRYGEDLARAEIAQVLGVPESVVKSRLYEAVRALEKRLGASQG
jgi:RNA polymerase sigma-70 factor (ECF subfamily)